MNSCKQALLVGGLCLCLTSYVFAGVSPEEAAKLKTTLTPLGAEKAGNADGTIPAWTGGYTTVDPRFKNGGKRPDPFADEKPLFSITAKNVDKYADKLDDGTKAMLKKFPDSYRLDIYPTHRTAAAPQWVYDNTFKNATRSKLVQNGDDPEVRNTFGGIPFPIPKSGPEAMWNALLRWRGTDWHFDGHQWLVTSDGRMVLTADLAAAQSMPYYYQELGTPEEYWKKYEGNYWDIRTLTKAPAIRAGEAIAGWQALDDSKANNWVYLTGQRRVRMLPNACCDTPSPSSAGVMSFDELEVYETRMGRFNWKIVGKKEMYIPYNANKILQPTKDSMIVGKHHLNPDYVRWELHRVWVVEATLKPGHRHPAARGLYYLDEDTWEAVLGNRWDAKGQLWRQLWALPLVFPDIPAVGDAQFGFYDLTSNTWYVSNLMNEKAEQFKIMPRYPARTFTGEALASESVR